MEKIERRTTVQFGLLHRGCTIPIGWIIEMIILVMLLNAVRVLTKICESVADVYKLQIHKEEPK